MTRWKNRTPEDKHRVMCEQAGYPLAEKLHAKLDSMKKGIPSLDEKEIQNYLLEWVAFHLDKKTYTHEQLRPIVEQVYHAEKVNWFFSLPHFDNQDARDKFINQMIAWAREDSPWPEDMKKKARQALQEIMGPEVSFEGIDEPYFKKKADEFFNKKR